MAEEPIVPISGVAEPKTEAVVTPEGVAVPAQVKGIPYDQYHEKLVRIKELEKENEELKSNPSTFSDDTYSDEGRVLKAEIDELKSTIVEVKNDNAKKDILLAHPELKDKWEDLEAFRQQPDNKGMNLRTAAKAFIIENDLLERPRIGLEKSTGGTKTPISQGMSNDDIKNLRENDSRKYADMLRTGQIKVE